MLSFWWKYPFSILGLFFILCCALQLKRMNQFWPNLVCRHILAYLGRVFHFFDNWKLRCTYREIWMQNYDLDIYCTGNDLKFCIFFKIPTYGQNVPTVQVSLKWIKSSSCDWGCHLCTDERWQTDVITKRTSFMYENEYIRKNLTLVFTYHIIFFILHIHAKVETSLGRWRKGSIWVTFYTLRGSL